MKVLTLEGNTVVDSVDYKDKPGRFLFFLCENGVFYLDTTIGKMWTLPPDPICKEHRAIVNKELEV